MCAKCFSGRAWAATAQMSILAASDSSTHTVAEKRMISRTFEVSDQGAEGDRVSGLTSSPLGPRVASTGLPGTLAARSALGQRVPALVMTGWLLGERHQACTICSLHACPERHAE